MSTTQSTTSDQETEQKLNPPYQVGFIYQRCYLQKQLTLADNITVCPFPAENFTQQIEHASNLLSNAGFSLSKEDIDSLQKQFTNHEHFVCIYIDKVEATNAQESIEKSYLSAESAAGAVAVISSNPTVPFFAFAANGTDGCIRHFVPPDIEILHATNIPGFLNTALSITTKAISDKKFNLLLRLYRASLRQQDVDERMQFQLILLEEASDMESGGLAEKLRTFATKIGFHGDLASITSILEIPFPPGKDVFDLITQLRNASVHNGVIDAMSVAKYAEWAVPYIANKEKLHAFVNETLRYMFCAMVGHTRELTAIPITPGPNGFVVSFD